MSESLPQQFTLGGSLAVDTFFFLSGLLTTFTLLRNMRKYRQDSFPALWFILMRFVRLTPLYVTIVTSLFCLFVFVCLFVCLCVCVRARARAVREVAVTWAARIDTDCTS
jgi:peptidoglycan/LPS O-acetylase OafA/YrhL